MDVYDVESSGENNSLVFICVDGSENSMRAFEWFYENCYQSNHTVGIVHVHSTNNKSTGKRRQSFEGETGGEEDSASIIQKYLSLSVQRGMKTKIYSKPRDKSDSVGQTICTLIKKNQPCFVVVGQRGIGVLQRTFFGSVSEYILKHAHKPTLIVPPLGEDEGEMKHERHMLRSNTMR